MRSCLLKLGMWHVGRGYKALEHGPSLLSPQISTGHRQEVGMRQYHWRKERILFWGNLFDLDWTTVRFHSPRTV